MKSTILKAVSVATVLFVGGLVLPRAAEAQARGTLQATATVVDTRTSFASLEAARGVIRSAGAARATQPAVATVAQLSMRRPEDRPSTVVVTIDYSRN